MILEILSIGATLVSIAGVVGVTVVVKNRDDNQLEREKSNIGFLESQAKLERREMDEHQMKDMLRSIVWKLNTRDRRQLLLGSGHDLKEVKEALRHLEQEAELRAKQDPEV